MVLEKRLHPSAKISHTASCNISLYRDTKEVIHRYTLNVYCCISTDKLEIKEVGKQTKDGAHELLLQNENKF